MTSMEPRPRVGSLGRARLGLAALGAFAAACYDSSSSSAALPEDPKVEINFPTTAPTFSVPQRTVELAGSASIDAWNYAREVEPNVRWYNQTTGAAGEASESCEWIWFFGYIPTNHTWSANVPLSAGANEIRVEAYYSGSASVVGSDSIVVHAQ